MSVERRFLTGLREADTDEAGLVLEDDGTVWVVAPGGARASLVGGGGGLPSQWTVGPHGNIAITADDPLTGEYLVRVDAPAGYGVADVFTVFPDPDEASTYVTVGTDANAEIVIRSESGPQEAKIHMEDNYSSPGNIDLSTWNGASIAPGSSDSVSLDVTAVAAHSGIVLRVTKAGSGPIFEVYADGSIHVKSGVTLTDDL